MAAVQIILFIAWGMGSVERTLADETVTIPGISTISVTGALVRMPDGRLMDWWSEGEKGARHATARFSICLLYTSPRPRA